LDRNYSSDRYSLFGKRPLIMTEINAELPPFMNGEHNYEGLSSFAHDITLLNMPNSVRRLVHASEETNAQRMLGASFCQLNKINVQSTP